MNTKLEELEARVDELEKTVKSISNNLLHVRELVQESLHLTESTSAIVVEHVTSLDARMGSVAGIMAEKIHADLDSLKKKDLVDNAGTDDSIEAVDSVAGYV